METHEQAYNRLAQNVAEAIAAVLGIEVTIMNQEFTRIAGTGRYGKTIGQKIEKDTVFDYCLRSGETYIIERVKKDPICLKCPQKGDCTEVAEICVPILFNEQAIGVIGIIAFSEEQRKKFIGDKESYLNFLEKMSTLLGAKKAELQMIAKNIRLSKRIKKVINILNESLIVCSADGDLIYQNLVFERLINDKGIKDQEGFVKSIWEHSVIQGFLETEAVFLELQEITFDYQGKLFSFMASVHRLVGDYNANEIIITLQNFTKIEEKMIQASVKNHKQLRFQDITGRSENFEEVKDIAILSASNDSNILILGESGTGKEVFARAIHNESSRKAHPFVPINCGAIPEELLESELFGHEKGSFTGAYRAKIGKFEVADQGTVFLDEIAEMPLHLQVKLLRVLQEREICRVGGNTVRKIDVRIISATNRDLLTRIKDGLFREDLYYRINVIPISIPPLRERKNDVVYLANYFLNHYACLYGTPIKKLSSSAKTILQQYHWPGNVRELQNVIEYAVNLESGDTINEELLETRLNLADNEFDISRVDRYGGSLSSCLYNIEKQIIADKIAELEGKENPVEIICHELKISRATLYRKLKKFNMSLTDETVS